MIWAVFQTMWLRLWRDKGALLLAFLIPGIIFAIFAAIFSTASGGSLDIRASMALTSDSPASVGFANNLQDNADFSLSYDSDWTEDAITERVRLGQDDVGFVISGDILEPNASPIKVIKDPSRDVAATILKGQLRQALASHMQGENSQAMPEIFEDISALSSVQTNGPSDQSVTYYIGATAILFLLFSAMQGASLSIDERNNGISDRLMVGSLGAAAMMLGKFIFLSVVGFVQAAIITGVAYVFFSVDILPHLPLLALACLGSAMLAASLALLVASFCKTSAQMHAVSTFLVLLFSAVGGSMVPRFMMPDWLQNISQFTPNHWSIEAFYGILARGQNSADLWLVWTILFGGAMVIFLISVFVSHKLMRV